MSVEAAAVPIAGVTRLPCGLESVHGDGLGGLVEQVVGEVERDDLDGLALGEGDRAGAGIADVGAVRRARQRVVDLWLPWASPVRVTVKVMVPADSSTETSSAAIEIEVWSSLSLMSWRPRRCRSPG